MSKFYLRIFAFLLLFFFISNYSFSQDIFNKKNLSQVKVDELSDADILKYQDQMKAKGITEDQAAQMALQAGLPASELAKLRQRIAAMNVKPAESLNKSVTTDIPVQNATAPSSPLDPRIFGAELFSSSSPSFQPNVKIATPVNYILGPDDQLQISISGLQEAAFNLTVSPEGSISIPNVGQIDVSGLSVEDATAKIRSRMASIAYGSLRSGASKLSITLGSIRSIRITILGSVKPGTYTISSLSTLFNALYLSGGPSGSGTFRRIELLRNGKIERIVDLYRFLLSGSEIDNVRLRENDIIRIPLYIKRVEIGGEVKRQGIFELLPNETASDLIAFASGFTENAYKASVKVYQVTPTDHRIKDLAFNDFLKYIPQPADVFEVSKILSSFQNRVSIQGAVLRPGNFELTPGLTVGELIKRAFLREDAYTNRGQILRRKSDLSSEIIPFEVHDQVNGLSSIQLQREDLVSIFSEADLRNVFNIAVQGEVKKPGPFGFTEGLTLKDVLLLAGGFTDVAYPQKIEIARLIKRDTLTAQDIRLSEIIELRNMDDLSMGSKNVNLHPGDVVTVRRLPGYLALESVIANGQVQFPGPYVLSNRAERISDLIKRAGGFTPEAFPDGAFLQRLNDRGFTTQRDAEIVDKTQKELKDTTGQITGAIQRPLDQIPLDLKKIMDHPGIDEDMVLKPNDQLFVPKNDEEIRISGEVLFPTLSLYSRDKTLKDYVNEAGGFTDNARQKKSYVIYPNGKAAATHHFLFFRSYPEVKPGSEIIIPKYIEKVKIRRNSTEILAFASAIASIVYIIIAISRL